MRWKVTCCLLLTIMVIGCSSNRTKTTGTEVEAVDDKNELPAELKAQLRAMGYTVPEKRVQRKSMNNPYENADMSHFMEGLDATFVFLDVQRDIQIVHNKQRAKTRYSPCSTFKIPNSLIALETGVMANADALVKWDKKKYPKQPFWDDLQKDFGLNWETDHTLQSAFKNSCVWCYMEIAERIGQERMQDYVKRFNFGNMDTASGKWPFWLDSSLQISALEQIAFLKRLTQQKLGLSAETYQQAMKVFEMERSGDAILYAKTGSGNHVGWFVGIVDKAGQQYVFAFNMVRAGQSPKAFARKRISIPKKILQELGIWM
ncbi:MAG: class D beta-lactamase [Deltaproteobacteria bacterium]|nr:class D beta-lactamase [Deltaproteobacteria bacterium]